MIGAITGNTTEGKIHITLEKIKECQQNDEQIKQIIEGLKSQNPSANTKGKTQIYKMDDGILHKKTTKVETPVVIPRSAERHVLWKYHNHSLENLPGWKETYRMI